MPDIARGEGLGKLILCGEHAVVYGYPAVAVAVDRRLKVRLRRIEGPTRPLGCTIEPAILEALADVIPVQGIGIEVESSIPLGRGMGSSAALAVALVRASGVLSGSPPSDDEVFERAFAIERIFHGNPSGLDHAVSSRGGAVAYRRGPPPSITPLACPELPLVVLDSGACGNTAELVAAVARGRPALDTVLDQIGQVVEHVLAHLESPAPALDAIGPLLTENHRLLSALGVSSPTLDHLVETAIGAGALGAKISGAGGGGVVLALAPEPAPVIEAAHQAGFEAFPVRTVSRGTP